MRYAWINGVEVPEKEAKLHIYDSSLMYGDLAFEMMRTFNRQTFRLKDHLDRLYQSCNVLQIPVKYTQEQVHSAHERLLEKHIEQYPEEEEWRTLINVSRGTLPLYQPLIGGGESVVVIACFPLRYVLRGKSYVYNGVDVWVPSQRSIPEALIDPKIKSRSRQHYKMADLEVSSRDPKAWALLKDPDDFITEGTGSNFFIVKDNQVFTPEGRNVLRGITRKAVMDICYWKGIECMEKNLTLYDVINSDEAFFTCTPFCIVPVRSVNGHKLKGGDMVDFLMKSLSKSVQCDFAEQARRWDVPVD